MTIAFVAAATGVQTSSGIDTTGANCIVVAIGSGGSTTISDSYGNTWTALTAYVTSGAATMYFYCLSPTVGAGHTFSTAQAYESLCAAAFSGVASFDQVTGQASGNPVASQTSITPSANGALILTDVGVGSNASSFAVDSGFTLLPSTAAVSGASYGVAMAYLIQTTAATASPILSWTSATASAGSDASFLAAVGGGAPTFLPSRFSMATQLAM